MRALRWYRKGDVRVETCYQKGDNLSIPGVYVGMCNSLSFGAAMNKGLGLTFKMGQPHMQHYMEPLLEKIQDDEI